MLKNFFRVFTLIVCTAACVSPACHNTVSADDPPLSQISGDINLDYRVDAADLFAFRYYMFGTLLITNNNNADMDKNGKMDIVDFILMKNAVIEQ